MIDDVLDADDRCLFPSDWFHAGIEATLGLH
jgi:hypothetical protein